jgi:octaprenyl-diphosphate synthase
MRQAAAASSAPARPWTTLFAPVAAELVAVEDRLRTELSSEDPFVDQLVKHAFRLGGKRLRPALLLLAGKACGQANEDHIILATVVEMIHTATLVHDDVLDEASLRRHQDTLNARNDNEASVLVGDFLFTHAFALASSLETTYACQVIGAATNAVCAGELRQIHSRGDYGLTEERYLSIIEAKTAELCACCCRLGAHYADADAPTTAALERYGRSLGIAFQIVDDILDLVGDERRAGKTLGADLKKEKLTLPAIHALAQLVPNEREAVVERLRRGGAVAEQTLAQQLAASDGLEYARGRAADFAREARESLAGLSWTPARDVLTQLTELVLTRGE